MAGKYAIFLDIDGTLAYSDNFPFTAVVSERNIQAIDAVRKAGHYVFFNTGRSYGWIPKEVLENAECDGVVSGVGTSITFRGESLFEDFVDKKMIKMVLQKFLPTGKTIMLGGTEDVFIANAEGDWKAPRFVKVTDADDFETKYPDAKIQKVEVFANEFTEDEKNFLKENFSVYAYSGYHECWNTGNSKAKAMCFVAEKLGVSIENCIAVGDSVNDIDVMKAAGISVAMGNATDEVKAIATYVTDACKDDGVAKILEKLILNF